MCLVSSVCPFFWGIVWYVVFEREAREFQVVVLLLFCCSILKETYTQTLQVPDESLHEQFSNLISLKQQEQNNTGDVLLPLAFALLMILCMRIFASGMHYIVANFISRMYVTKEQNADLYLLMTRPSLLLWISIYFVSSNDENNEDFDTFTML